ncbi:Hypothetical predicted protein [Mytilus galloprovincialis]|uniref:DZIP3-like HEPN domain-containing protein n=1 Tax=Mytilus galloprovincialis TaxID=29158 RepID=A0A8B6FCR7_MYTGA|nr:Hypothetical predicted protein [Mytilus galloprovincialis]
MHTNIYPSCVEREERNIIRKEPEIALQESLGADQVKVKNKEERNIIRKEPEIALQETLAADTVKAEGEERNIIRKEPEIALQESLGADQVNAEREESNMIYTRKEQEISLPMSFRADKMKYTKEEINFTKMGMIVLNILVDVLYDLLKPDKPNLRPRSDVYIPYLYFEHRKLNKHIPSNLWGGTWQTIQNTDIVIGDDIERIRLIRNELQHSPLFQLEDKRFLELYHIISDLLKRFDRHNKPTMLYADRLNEILTKAISIKEIKSIEIKLMDGVANESEDEKRIRLADNRAVQKIKAGKTDKRSNRKRPAEASGSATQMTHNGTGGTNATFHLQPFRWGFAARGQSYGHQNNLKTSDVSYNCGMQRHWTSDCIKRKARTGPSRKPSS